VADQVAALGEPGRAAAGAHGGGRADQAELSRREHVHNVLVKLDCQSRVDIARRASELGPLSSSAPAT
jgi:hypothetical protein